MNGFFPFLLYILERTGQFNPPFGLTEVATVTYERIYS